MKLLNNGWSFRIATNGLGLAEVGELEPLKLNYSTKVK
jgi:hypothetical protein